MRDWKFFILEHKRTVETCRLSMEASVLLLSFLFHSGMIIPLSSGCFAGKSTKFLNLFCWYSFSLFHSLNTSSKYNFILSCKGWPAMSSHREFYQDYCRLEFLTKYLFAPRLAKSDAMIKFLIVVHLQWDRFSKSCKLFAFLSDGKLASGSHNLLLFTFKILQRYPLRQNLS